MSNGLPISALVNHDPQQQQHPQTFTQFNRDYYKWNYVHPFPCDEKAGERLDCLHELIYGVCLKGSLHLSELDPTSTLRVLDVGYGTGQWSLYMATEYPNAQITGIDLLPFLIQHPFANIRNLSPVDFTSDRWGGLKEASFDFLHLAQLCGSVPSWEHLYTTAFRYLKPGTGQIELVEIDWMPRSAPIPFPESAHRVADWYNHLATASTAAGLPIAYREDTSALLEAAGFVDISSRKIRLPFHHNELDPQEWKITAWHRAAMGGPDSPLCENSFATLSMLHLCRHYSMTPVQVAGVCRDVARDVARRGTPLYNNLHIWTARRPMVSAPARM